MSPTSRFVPASPNYSVVRRVRPGAIEAPHMPWMHRLKTDHRLSQAPFRAKSSSQVVQVAISPFWTVSDTVNPPYLRSADVKFLRSIENLVTAVRGLTSPNYKNAHQMLRRIPLYHDALQAFMEWRVDEIREEWTTFRREPRGRLFTELEPVVKLLLRPVYRLSKLNLHVHLMPALAKMLDLTLIYVNNPDEREKLKRFHAVARVELGEIFESLRLTLYPVLVKLFATRFLEPDEFFVDYHEAILKWLELTERDLVQVTDETALEPPEDEEKVVLEVPEPPEVPRLAEIGFELLDQMFPKAGWRSLDDKPDFHAYFQPVLEAPKGSDLIAVDDPLQIVLPLSEILQQLFYGFQSVQWGIVRRGASGDMVPLQEWVDKIVARWHFFVEEFFGKNYLPLLQEYCREVERSGPVAVDSRRREHQLLWFQRNYALPFLSLPVMDDIRVKSLGYPNLAVQVRELLDLLSAAAVEWLQDQTSTAVLNPDAKVQFPISNAVTTRFKAVMKRTLPSERKQVDRGTNRSLILASVALLSSLDYLLSSPDSPLYGKRPAALFRSVGALGEEKPVYNAPLRNTLALLRKLNDRPPPTEDESPWALPTIESIGGLSIREDLRQRLGDQAGERRAFAVVSLHVWSARQRSQFPDLWAQTAPRLRLHGLDDGSWMVSVPDAPESAESLVRSVLSAAAQRDPPVAVGALIIPFFSQWTLDKVLMLPAQGWKEAQSIPPQVLGVWSPLSGNFDFRTDVPTVTIDQDDSGEAEEPDEQDARADDLPESSPKNVP